VGDNPPVWKGSLHDEAKDCSFRVDKKLEEKRKESLERRGKPRGSGAPDAEVQKMTKRGDGGDHLKPRGKLGGSVGTAMGTTADRQEGRARPVFHRESSYDTRTKKRTVAIGKTEEVKAILHLVPCPGGVREPGGKKFDFERRNRVAALEQRQAVLNGEGECTSATKGEMRRKRKPMPV